VNTWAKDASRAAVCINAKAETVDSLPSFREAFEKRRCVVPADGFYEWRSPKTKRAFTLSSLFCPFQVRILIFAEDNSPLAVFWSSLAVVAVTLRLTAARAALAAVNVAAFYIRYGIVCGPCGNTHSVATGPAAFSAADTASPTSCTGSK
jgi:hypothetical protein